MNPFCPAAIMRQFRRSCVHNSDHWRFSVRFTTAGFKPVPIEFKAFDAHEFEVKAGLRVCPGLHADPKRVARWQAVP